MQSYKNPISQREFLTGLKNLINAAKRARIYDGRLSRRHLPNGICSGYALQMTKLRHPGLLAEFQSNYAWIAGLRYSTELHSWAAANPDKALHLLGEAEKLLSLHYFSSVDHTRFPTDYTSATGLDYEAALSVNLPPREIAGFLQTFVLNPQFKYSPQCLLVSNGEHMIEINVSHPDRIFTLHDANGAFIASTKNMEELAKHIYSRFQPLHRYAGGTISLSVAVLSDANDPEFAGLLNELQQFRDKLPASVRNVTLLSGCAPREVLTNLLTAFVKGQSKIGFLNEVLMYRDIIGLSDSLHTKISSYLAGRPNMLAVVRHYGQFVNARNENGYTWLHHAVMSHEKYVVRTLLKAGADPNLLPERKMTEQASQSTQTHAGGRKAPAPAIRGLDSETFLSAGEDEIRIMETRFEHSSPMHYIAQLDDPELYAWMMEAGASLEQRCGGRPDGKTARDYIKPGSRIDAHQKALREQAHAIPPAPPVHQPAPPAPVVQRSVPPAQVARQAAPAAAAQTSLFLFKHPSHAVQAADLPGTDSTLDPDLIYDEAALKLLHDLRLQLLFVKPEKTGDTTKPRSRYQGPH